MYLLIKKIIPNNKKHNTIVFLICITSNINGYMQYKGKTYLPNMTKLSDLPGEIRDLFIEKKLPTQNQRGEAKEEIRGLRDELIN